MKRAEGFALITTLLLASVLVMLSLALLQSSLLSMRVADSGQQGVQLRHQSWLDHRQYRNEGGRQLLSEATQCPALYAAWAGSELTCSRYLLLTAAEQQWFSAGVGSIVVQLQLSEESIDD